MHKLPFLLIAAAMTVVAPNLVAATPAESEAKPAVPAASGKLDIGSPAPEFKPAKWIKGEPVTAFEKDKVYLIECWATWCGPCVAAIPHVNELHEKFKDKGLVIIGADVWEDPVEKPEAFVKKKGDEMAYRVAFVGKDGAIAKDWLKAAGVSAIPHAFVVRENKLYWQGHPSALTEAVVADMIAGKYDSEKAARIDKKERAQANSMRAEQNRLLAMQKKFDAQIKEGKVTEAEATFKEAEELCLRILPMRLRLFQENSAMEIALAKGDKKTAVARLRDYAEATRSDRKFTDLEWNAAVRMVIDERFSGARDYALALECVDSYMKKSPFGGRPIPRFLRARLLHATGKVDEAKALLAELAPDAAKLEGWKEASDALAVGKDWPAGKMNPDALPAATPVAPVAK